MDKLSIENARLKEEVRQLSNERKSFEASDEQFAARETHVIILNLEFTLTRAWYYFDFPYLLFALWKWSSAKIISGLSSTQSWKLNTRLQSGGMQTVCPFKLKK